MNNKGLYLALLVVGIILIVFGLMAMDSLESGVAETVTGTPSRRGIIMLTVGILGALAGGGGLLMNRR